MVLTFDPHPPRVLRPDKAPPLLMTPDAEARGARASRRSGRWRWSGSRWSCRGGSRTCSSAVCSSSGCASPKSGSAPDFLFGRDRSGNFTLLRALGQQFGFRVEKIDPIRYKDFVVSSTRIRRLVSEGRVEEAGALLGRHFTIEGTVVEGARRGRELGFPTANLATDNELLPPNGVYATFSTIGGIVYPGVTNVGVRPTFDGPPKLSVETHVLGFSGDLYGQRQESVIRPAAPGRAPISRRRRAARADRRRRSPGRPIIR